MAEKSETKNYRCKEPIQHNGDRYEPGAKIALGDEHATSLLEAGHIEPLKAEKAAPAEQK